MRANEINAFVGLPYEAGRFDCADLAILVQGELFGRKISLPSNRPQGSAGQAAAIRRGAQEHAVRIEKSEAKSGDGLLIVSGSGKSALLHIGTLFYIGGMAYVLHASATVGHSVLHKLSELPAFGLRVEGFYQWK